MSLQSLFNKKVNILRITNTPGAMGTSEVATVLHLDMPCRINWKNGSQKIFFNRKTYFRDGVIYCNPADITEADRVQYGSKIYHIVGVNDTDEDDRLLKITIKLVE